MSLGDAIRGLIDPLHPAVREWLQRELPRLVREGYIEEAQAGLIARQYGVRLSGATEASASVAAETSPSAQQQLLAAAPEVVAEAPAPGATAPRQASGPPVAGTGQPVSTPVAGSVTTGRPAASPFLADHAVSIVLYLGAFLSSQQS